jgi:ArsR family transcriptional regulator
MVPPRQGSDLVHLFAALSDRTRLRLLNLMNGREVCVCYFVEILKQSQPKVSRHLAYLRKAGIVTARREGKWINYSIRWPANEGALAILNTALKALQTDRTMQQDLTRLSNACCGNATCLVTLQGAPVPAQLEDTIQLSR